MDNVFIDIGGVLEVAQSFDSCLDGIRDQQDEMRRLLNTTDPRVLDRHNIRERINNSIKELCWEEDKLRQIQNVLRFAANSYAQAERTIKQQDREFSSRIDSLVKNVASESGGILNSIENAFSNAGRFIEDEAQAAEKKFETGAKVLQGEAEAAWNGITDWVGKHKKAIIIAAAAIALIAIGIATCGIGDAAIFAVLGAGAIGAGSGLAGEEISDYMDDGKIDNSDQSYVGSAVGGFITGAICPVGGTEAVGLKGVAAQFAKNGLGGMAGNAAGQQISTGKIDFKEAFVSGAISGVLTTAAGKISVEKSVSAKNINIGDLTSEDLKTFQAENWYYKDGSLHFPPKGGAIPRTEIVKPLLPGEKLIRYGNISKSSDYVAVPGTLPENLSLPPYTDLSVFNKFEVVRPIPNTVESKALPWGGDPGLGTQYHLPMTIKDLILIKYIRELK